VIDVGIGKVHILKPGLEEEDLCSSAHCNCIMGYFSSSFYHDMFIVSCNSLNTVYNMSAFMFAMLELTTVAQHHQSISLHVAPLTRDGTLTTEDIFS
jgi:hypothetical protein